MKQYFGKFDYSQHPVLYDPLEIAYSIGFGNKVTLDGRTIEQVWYADTESGILKTYDVFRDGKPRTTSHGFRYPHTKPLGDVYSPDDFPGREVDCPPDGVLSETLRGKVEIWGPE